MDPVTPLNPAQTAVQEAQASRDSYLLRVLIALDDLGDVLIGGSPDQTISTTAAMDTEKHRFLGSVVSHLLDQLQPDHGADATAGDLQRAEAEVSKINASGIVNQ